MGRRLRQYEGVGDAEFEIIIRSAIRTAFSDDL
jgi:hypothetical protein